MVKPSSGVMVRAGHYPGGAMPRPPKDDDATQNLRPEDKTQRAKNGTTIGLLRKAEVLADFRKIATENGYLPPRVGP